MIGDRYSDFIVFVQIEIVVLFFSSFYGSSVKNKIIIFDYFTDDENNLFLLTNKEPER